MKLTFCFDRNKPFADVPAQYMADDLVEDYAQALTVAIGDRFPTWDVVVRAIDEPHGDVEFSPEGDLSEDERLSTALEVKRTARRVADTMYAAYLQEARDAFRRARTRGPGE